MSRQSIIDAVDKTVGEFCDDFHSHPTRFFTETDVMCRFYSILQQNLPFSKILDKDGCEHFLVHREYPTPFRCDMSGSKFELKDDDARTEKGGKYIRGHYDIVILNPEFISQHSYEVIKAQNYELYKSEVLSQINSSNPVILYGIEFMYKRDPLKYSRGKTKEKGIDNFIANVIQDADKLLASKNLAGGMFMGKIKMLTFIKGSSQEICSLLREKLSCRDEIVLCFGD